MGMRIGYGTSAKENTLAVMSWSEVESHIRVMVENGTYMSANEVFLVNAVERERIATDINNFFRDGISEMPENLELKFLTTRQAWKGYASFYQQLRAEN